jgi:hypothetical protein
MSRPDAKEWREAFDKEINGLKKRIVFSVVDRPTDDNQLGTTMVYNIRLTMSRIQSLANIAYVLAEIVVDFFIN